MFGFPHDQLKVLRGGFPAWEQAGYRIETTPAAVHPKGKRLMAWGKIKSK